MEAGDGAGDIAEAIDENIAAERFDRGCRVAECHEDDRHIGVSSGRDVVVAIADHNGGLAGCLHQLERTQEVLWVRLADREVITADDHLEIRHQSEFGQNRFTRRLRLVGANAHSIAGLGKAVEGVGYPFEGA